MVGQPANIYPPAQVYYPVQNNNLQQFQRPVPMVVGQPNPTIVGLPTNASYAYPLCTPNPPVQQQSKASTSAVTINIIEPKAFGAPEQPLQQPAPSYSSIPNASIYDNSGYVYPQVPVVTTPQVVYPQAPIDYNTGQFPILNQNQAFRAPDPVIYHVPAPQQPVSQQAPYIYGLPPGVVPGQIPGQIPVQIPVQQPGLENLVPPTNIMQPAQPYPPPVIEPALTPVVPEANPQVQQPPMVEGQQAQPAEQPQQPELSVNDLPAINAALVQGDEKVKATAIEAIARIGQGDKDTYVNLINLINRNPGSIPADQQAIAKDNKLHAMYTLAILNKNQNPQVSFAELPGIDNIVEVIKKDKDPEMRKKAVAVLDFLARKEDIAILTKLYNIALKKENNQVVKEALKRGLYNLGQLAKDKA